MFSYTPHGLGLSGLFVDCCSGPSSNKKKLMTSIVPWCSLQESIQKFMILFTALSLYLTFEWLCFFLLLFSCCFFFPKQWFAKCLFYFFVVFKACGIFSSGWSHSYSSHKYCNQNGTWFFSPQLGVIISSSNQLWPFLTLYCSFKSTD